MDQSTQTSSKAEFSPFIHAGSLRYSDFDYSDNTTSPRHKYPLFLPSKTHLGFQTARVKGQTSIRRSALLRRPQVAENKHQSPRQRIEKDLRTLKGIPVRKTGSSESQNGGEPGLIMDGYRVSHASQGVGFESRASGNRPDVPALFVRSKTMTLGSHSRKGDRSYRQPSSSASNRRHCDACSVDIVRHWLKSQDSGSAEKRGNRKLESSPETDDVSMSYAYYTPLQLLAQQDEEDKSTPRDMAAITTVSVPKKGRLKLTGFSCELNNPDIYDNQREETNLKLQQKLYNEEMMGPALPSTTSDLYRGTLLKNKSILKQVKQGEQMLEREEEATRHRKHWQEPDDRQLEDLIGQLLHYDMPEVPTINKNFQTFAGYPANFPTTSGQQDEKHQNKNNQDEAFTSGKDRGHQDSPTEENSFVDTDQDKFFPNKPQSRHLKSRSAQERTLDLDDDNPHVPNSPQSLNIRVGGLPQTSAGPNSARTLRDAKRSGGVTNGFHPDWPLPWEHCDSLHSVLTHAQKITLSRTQLKRK